MIIVCNLNPSRGCWDADVEASATGGMLSDTL